MEFSPSYESREWFRTTLASVGDAVIATDTQGRVVFLNPTAAALTGWSEAAALGWDITEVFTIVHEDTRQVVENPVTRVLREGVVVGLANRTLLRARDGRERPIDDSGAPIRDADGRLLGVVLVFRDVTERRQAEAIHARLAAIVESADDAIISKNMAGIITSWNRGAERLYGYTAAEMVGQPIARLIPPDLADDFPRIMTRLRQGERLEHYETQRVAKDGTRIDVALTISPLRDPTGQLIGASKIARNITERRRAEEAQTLLAAIVESSDDAILSKTLDGIVTSWNRGAERLYGYTAAEMVGQSLMRLIPPDLANDLPQILARLRRGGGHRPLRDPAPDQGRHPPGHRAHHLAHPQPCRPAQRGVHHGTRYHSAEAGRGRVGAPPPGNHAAGGHRPAVECVPRSRYRAPTRRHRSAGPVSECAGVSRPA